MSNLAHRPRMIPRPPTVRNTKANGRIQATHGSFDNNIDVLTATIERMRGKALVAEMEWLDD